MSDGLIWLFSVRYRVLAIQSVKTEILHHSQLALAFGAKM